MPFFALLLTVSSILSFAIINAPPVGAIENPYDTLTKGARGWYALRFIRDHNRASGPTLSEGMTQEVVDKMQYVPQSGQAPDCFDYKSGYLLEPSRGVIARNGYFGCFSGDATAENAFNAAFQGIGYDRTSFITTLGYKKDESGLYKGGSMSEGALSAALSSANISSDTKGSVLGMPGIGGEPAAWMQYLDLLAGIEKAGCLKAGLREFPDPAGNISLVEADGVTIKKYKVQAQDKKIIVAVEAEITCAQAIERLGDGDGGKAKSFAAAYAKLVDAAPKSCEQAYPLAPDNTACIDGFSNKGDRSVATATAYCSKYPWASASTQYTACVFGVTRASGAAGSVVVDPSTGGVSGVPGEKTQTCGIAGIGWIVCPVMTFVSSLNDTMYGFIASMLVIEPGLFDTSDTGPYVAWQQFQGIANVLFVVAFLVIIYSQITSVGISNYGVKKLLPKLIVVAILVNISYFMCQLAVDVSNILGVGLKSMFDSMAAGDIGKAVTNTHGWTAVVGGIIAGVGGAALLLLAVSVPVLVSAFLALSMIILILIARKAIIVMLIVVSPIAFVLYLLPNTENLFKKWWKLFSSLLMLYPVIAVVFGASSLAATILMGLPGDANQIAALGASAIPLFVVPGMLKGALAATGKLGAKMQGWGDKATGRVGAKIGESRLGDLNKHRQQSAQIRRAKSRAGVTTGSGYNPVNWGNHAGAHLNRLTNRALPRGMRDKYANQANSLEENEFNEQVKSASSDVSTTATSAALGSGKNIDGDYDMSAFHAASDAKKAAIIEHVMAKGSFDERRALVEASGGLTGANASRLRKRISEGAYAKGDQNIYGAGIGAKIITGGVTGGKVLREETLKNINDGHVSAEHLVQGESAAEYMVDTATGATQDKFDSAGNQTKRGAATGVGAAADHTSAKAALKASYTNAQTNTGTRSKLNDAYNATLGRVV